MIDVTSSPSTILTSIILLLHLFTLTTCFRIMLDTRIPTPLCLSSKLAYHSLYPFTLVEWKPFHPISWTHATWILYLLSSSATPKTWLLTCLCSISLLLAQSQKSVSPLPVAYLGFDDRLMRLVVLRARYRMLPSSPVAWREGRAVTGRDIAVASEVAIAKKVWTKSYMIIKNYFENAKELFWRWQIIIMIKLLKYYLNLP